MAFVCENMLDAYCAYMLFLQNTLFYKTVFTFRRFASFIKHSLLRKYFTLYLENTLKKIFKKLFKLFKTLFVSFIKHFFIILDTLDYGINAQFYTEGPASPRSC